jgi:hypothetical protein
MIPKILHTSFFGDWPWSPMNLRCHASWDKCLPGFKRMHWSRDNLSEECLRHPWMKAAVKDLLAGKKVSGAQLNFMAYLRDWALLTHGGIWIDNDVELLREPELEHEAFVGWQTNLVTHLSVNCAIMGSVPGHWFSRACLDRTCSLDPECAPTSTGPEMLTAVLRENGLRMDCTEQTVKGVKVYPLEVLYPWSWVEKPDRSRITERTIALHWWECSWAPHARSPVVKDDF